MRETEHLDMDATWLSVLHDLPTAVLRFGSKGLLNCLPSPNNVARWKKSPNPNRQISAKCLICEAPNCTTAHILSNCPAAMDRILGRHNNILTVFTDFVRMSLLTHLSMIGVS